MKKKTNFFHKICGCTFLFLSLALTGCGGEGKDASDEVQAGVKMQEETEQPEETLHAEQPQQINEPSKEDISQTEKTELKEPEEPAIKESDWSDYFGGLDGSAVIFDPSENCYRIYNEEQALTRRSPCSTFKIISSLVALENGVIEPDDSTRAWSGETFWNEEWNRDIDFVDAFHASCVWYFREVVDEIGTDLMQEELDKLGYGNCDISDWEGRLNTNNNNPALTGFWIESSLLISPKEQVDVLERIFGNQSEYAEEALNELKQVMLLPEQEEAGLSIYGKTGMGKAHGILVDAWFTGFAERDNSRVYFCVHLDETGDESVSSATTREIAVKVVRDAVSGEQTAQKI